MFAKSALLGVALLALEASAFWRLPCIQRLSLDRIDPIDTPGNLAYHAHTIHGGNNFNMSTTNDDLRDSTCSSCSVKEDKSAYWTPNLYWEAPNGELTALNQTGGMLVYYLLRGEDIQPFPADFKLIAGDNRLRDFPWDDSVGKSLWGVKGLSKNQDFLRQMAIGFNCLNYEAPAKAALGLQKIPQGLDCPNGLRAEVFFPSCWDGINSDSADHKSHMAYPSTMDDGDCPSTHPIRLPSLFFETIWNIGVVSGKGGRLVFSNGDAVGTGYHGDFMNGWDQDVLTSAINKCTDPSGLVEKCGEFTFWTEEEYGQCTNHQEAKEDIWGPMKKLPGCNVITDGPDYAPKAVCDGQGKVTATKAASAATTPAAVVSVASVAPIASVSSVASVAPIASVSSVAPIASVASVAPIASVASVAPIASVSSVAPAAATTSAEYSITESAGGSEKEAVNSEEEVTEDDVVVVTVTKYESSCSKTVQGADVFETVTASPVTTTVAADSYVRRHIHEHHAKRHH